MTESEALIKNVQTEVSPNSSMVDADEQQILTLRALLKLPVAERNALLAQHAATIAEFFVPGSEEMEWAEEYVEDDNWDDE